MYAALTVQHKVESSDYAKEELLINALEKMNKSVAILL